ncbi:peptide chain release factor N(5)-glutamine methyltransferase [Candidatus Saccharibacteria bacterium]|nr:peptide chain release factor N(5)-glutamine methyltransferase [Candidatus Saccharibacteria bacterium]
MRIKDWLKGAERVLSDVGVKSSALDAELLLVDEMGVERTYLHAHGDIELEVEVVKKVDEKLARRATRTPLAYVRGFKEFYGRKFVVTEDVLVPRPETEEVIEVLRRLGLDPKVRAADVGTGSGVIGITVWLEGLAGDVVLIDKNTRALEVARKNAKELGAEVVLVEGDLLTGIGEEFDVVMANLPYVDEDWEVSKETRFEPREALFADDEGLELYKKLVQQTPSILVSGGYLVMEADVRQHNKLIELGQKTGFELVEVSDLIVVMKLL